jgi:hypothetical protein
MLGYNDLANLRTKLLSNEATTRECLDDLIQLLIQEIDQENAAASDRQGD